MKSLKGFAGVTFLTWFHLRFQHNSKSFLNRLKPMFISPASMPSTDPKFWTSTDSGGSIVLLFKLFTSPVIITRKLAMLKLDKYYQVTLLGITVCILKEVKCLITSSTGKDEIEEQK